MLKQSPLLRLVLDGNPQLVHPHDGLVRRGPEAVVQFLRDKATFGVERAPLFLSTLAPACSSQLSAPRRRIPCATEQLSCGRGGGRARLHCFRCFRTFGGGITKGHTASYQR